MASLFPNYKDYDPQYQRYYQKLTKEPYFLDEITMEEAQSYFYNNIICTNIINYTFKYILSQIHKNITLETYLVLHTIQFQQIRTRIPQYAIIITFDGIKYAGMLWDTLNQIIFLINRNSQIESAFTDQSIYHIQSYSKDLLSEIAALFIRFLNNQDKHSTQIQFNFQQFTNESLIKWAMLKQYRNKQMKLNGESYSKIFDDDFLKDINQSPSNSSQQTLLELQKVINNQSKSFSQFSQPNQLTQNQNKQTTQRLRQRSLFKISNKNDLSQEQVSTKQLEPKQNDSNLKQNQLPQLNKYPKQNQNPQIILQVPQNHQIDSLNESISVSDFLNYMNNFKQHILTQDLKDQSNPTTYPFFNPEQVLKLKLDDMETLLQDQVRYKKNTIMKPTQKLLHLLKYYSKHNPYQYQIIVNKYSDFIHERLLERMGLPQTVKNVEKDLFSFSSIPQSKKREIDQKIIQDQVINLRFNQEINMYEYNQLKDQLILSQNLMDVYFNYLQETFQRVLILPFGFYQILSENFLKAKSYTDQYQGSGKTIFDQFDQIIIPIKLTKHEYVGVYIDFNYRIMYFINTLARSDRKFPFRVEILDMPIMQNIVRFIKNEYNTKIMKSFNILQWSNFSLITFVRICGVSE
ncbi:unnamed protein product [Paramecium sonneborni]|uniref:Uncharacterized protein n=1 Tax=Paramecium sonneborni TaxID=65129 RepID=A0A8S1RIA4_9CILI|nr:unnamed protein product [Paramecium sonneborni]